MANSIEATVIGGGISGLACAYRLQQLGVATALFEASERFGGLAGTIEKDGFLFESGPQSFQGTGPLLELIGQLGIRAELLEADPHAPRFVLRHGKLQRIPMSPQALIASSLLGAGSRWKVISERFRKTRPPDTEESVANFVRRKFGHEILEYLVAPFVSGVYAGDPEKLSLRAAFPTLEEWEREYGSVLRGAMKSRPEKGARKGPPSLCSFRHGVGSLMSTLGEKLGDNAHLSARVINVSRSRGTGEPAYEIRVARAGRDETVASKVVVMATPAYAAEHLLDSISAPLARTLSGIAYAPVVVVAAGYHSHQIGQPLEGFGFLVPRSEHLRTLGTVFNSSLFVGRAAKEMAVLTSFAGGATDLEIVERSEKEIAEIVRSENAKVLGIMGPPVTTTVWKYPKALPQYNLGHGHTVEAIREGERANAGLFLSGNYLEGPSMGKCVEQGFRTGEAVRRYLQRTDATTDPSTGSGA
jgi:oxygen-dependent protoporphyrinogen oxidase